MKVSINGEKNTRDLMSQYAFYELKNEIMW